MMRTLEWLNLDNLYRECQVMSLYRLMKSGHGHYTYMMFNLETRMYRVRKPTLRLTWTWKNEPGRTCFIQQSVRTWNDIDIGSQKFDDVKLLKLWLKNKLKTYYSNHNLY